MPFRPLVIVSGLTVGDYVLWNWSLNANHDVLALVSGLTLPPLAIVCLWLLAVNVARLLARGTRRGTPRVRRRARAPRSVPSVPPASVAPAQHPATTASRPSRKIAA